MRLRSGFWMGFTWVHCNGESSHTSACLASYHHPRSITWRWALYWIRPTGIGNLRLSRWRPPNDKMGSVTLALPLVGALSLSWQEHLFRLTTPSVQDGNAVGAAQVSDKKKFDHGKRDLPLDCPVGALRSSSPSPQTQPATQGPISPTCEVLTGKDANGNWLFCGLPAVKAYPAMGGGWMALCYKHGLKHDEAFPTDELIRGGNTWEGTSNQ